MYSEPFFVYLFKTRLVMKKIVLILICFLVFQMNAQVLNGKIIDANTKLPLENASVFVENSSIATMSKKDGTFRIDLRGLKNNVVIDYVGYVTYLIPKEDFIKSNFTIFLKPSDENLAEMIIHKPPFSRKEMMECFKKYFLGTTSKGKGCKILNEDDIVLYYDLSTFTLRAEASAPIIIDNKKLGYRVNFHLTDFRANFQIKSLVDYAYLNSSFNGYSFFEDTSKGSKSIKEHRLLTYKEGIPYIMKALVTNKLKDEGYVFYVNKFPVVEKDYFTVTELDNGYIIRLLKRPTIKRKKIKSLSSFGRVMTDDDFEMVEEFTNLILLNKNNNNQTIFVFVDEAIAIDLNGNLLNTNGLYFGGYHGSLKLGDMLPVDYEYEK